MDALGNTCSAARGVSLDTLHTSVRAGRNGNKHSMVPTRQGAVLTVAAAAAAAASSVAAATDAARGPTAADDAARGAVKPTAADDAARGIVKSTVMDDADGLCRRACRDHHRHGLREYLGPRCRDPGCDLTAVHLRLGHGCRRHFRSSSWSPRSVPGLPPVHRT